MGAPQNSQIPVQEPNLPGAPGGAPAATAPPAPEYVPITETDGLILGTEPAPQAPAPPAPRPMPADPTNAGAIQNWEPHYDPNAQP